MVVVAITITLLVIVSAIVAIYILEDYQINEDYDHCIPRDDKNGGVT